ncbi:prepilin peptidase [Sphingomonas sp. JC676]|uniref:prepilin peptidase n=1 Tax=Sphingomonas sp. JC676 TaxID=2768065 RepID=UPI001657CEA9|nr:A24 family peptidase [Sphingomonas sp. JC676]MBC9031293.1 prepilin peptidase [Sphingomonas sp. JC676]
MTIEVWGWPLLLGVLGLVFGSFIATLAIRWPQERSVSQGRSECDSCGKALTARELVPVLSYVLQRGRCRGCGAVIRPSHLVTELLGMVIGVGAGLVAPGLEGAAGAVFGWLLLALAALDLAAFWLPNLLTGTLALAGFAVGLLTDFPPGLNDRLLGWALGFGGLWLVATLYRAVRKRHGLGGGDPKMLGAIGLWLGWNMLPIVLLVACLTGLAVVAALLLAGRRVDAATRLPFGVLLAIGGFAVWLVIATTPSYPAGTVITLVSVSQ